jgi:hypothetical protein
MLTWEVQFCKSSCITPHGGEVFRGIAEECHWWHTRPTNLINTSQATRYFVGTPDYPSGIPDMHTIHDPMISVS